MAMREANAEAESMHRSEHTNTTSPCAAVPNKNSTSTDSNDFTQEVQVQGAQGEQLPQARTVWADEAQGLGGFFAKLFLDVESEDGRAHQ